eukprot:gene4212-4624_t
MMFSPETKIANGGKNLSKYKNNNNNNSGTNLLSKFASPPPPKPRASNNKKSSPGPGSAGRGGGVIHSSPNKNKSPASSSSSLINTSLPLPVITNEVDPKEMHALELADHLLVLANQSRKIMFYSEREVLPHSLLRVVKFGESSLEDSEARLNFLLAEQAQAANEPYIGVSDVAEQISEFEGTAERLQSLAKLLDSQLSVEIVE